MINEKLPILAASKRSGRGSGVVIQEPRQEKNVSQCCVGGLCYYISAVIFLLGLLVGALSPFLDIRHSAEVAPSIAGTLDIGDNSQTLSINHQKDSKPSGIPTCPDGRPCFQPARIQVPTTYPGFPSFWNYATAGSMNVTYDSRSILINSQRSLFLGGSLHPSRATKATWSHALNEAVRNGLNLITIYVFWASHQPTPNQTLDFRLPSSTVADTLLQAGMGMPCDDVSDGVGSCTPSSSWDLAQAIKSAANRGLFVHIRIGPYDCAEYSYGGIPEWLPLQYPEMHMRRPDQEWMTAMAGFVNSTIQYLTQHNLWAWQGGPIIMGQIENELGGDDEVKGESPIANLAHINNKGQLVSDNTGKKEEIVRNVTLQDYANWCGKLVTELAPRVVWTMCNGLSAPETISTFNGDYFVENWLENNGESGRIQVDQPAIWTENEGKAFPHVNVVRCTSTNRIFMSSLNLVGRSRRLSNMGR